MAKQGSSKHKDPWAKAFKRAVQVEEEGVYVCMHMYLPPPRGL
jgi:hypothetical protein